MTEREVNTGMVVYTDVNGVQRMGLRGETVDVHPDNLARFASLNGGIEVAAPAKKAAPKKAAPRRK